MSPTRVNISYFFTKGKWQYYYTKWDDNIKTKYILQKFIYIINNKKMSNYALMLKFIIIGDSGKLFLILFKRCR
jgi:hypothetical protein